MYKSKLRRHKGGMDWLQLGCIISWIVDNTQNCDYHEQSLNPDHALAFDEFFLGLWNDGVYNEVLVGEFRKQEFVGNVTIEDVLKKRND